MATFQVYCDESGNFKDTPYSVFSAFVFEGDDVAGFIRKWNEILTGAGLKYVHMRDAMGFRKEFKGWSEREGDRDDILEQLGRLAIDRAVWMSESTSDSATFKALPAADRKRLKGDPLYAGFEAILKQIVADAAQRHRSDDRFHIVYDLSEQHSPKCLDLFISLRRMQTPYRQFFPSLTFADDTEFPPLQAADMAAFCMKEQFLKGRCDGIVGKLLEIYNSHGKPQEGAIVYSVGDSLGGGKVER